MARETPPRPVLLFACEGVDAGAWRAEIDALQAQVEVRFWPDAGDPRDVTAGFAWGNPPGFWRRFPNLRAIFSLGAGVDTLLADRDLPTSAQVVRMLDDSMASDMSDFVRMCVTYHHRAMHEYAVLQAEGVWRSIRPPRNARRTVGVMGLGALGGRCALDLAAAGFAVRGWARRSRTLPDIATFTGEVEFEAFLAATEILVCLLPLTPETEDILSARVFSALPRGACVINVGRGRQLVDDDLLAALDSGHIAAATLDVFRVEPLPADHPFWRHPRITVVPHAAAFTHPDTAVPALAANLRRLLDGAPLAGVVDRTTGY